MADVDTRPLHPTGKRTPWHAPHLDQPRRPVTLNLPEPAIQALLEAQETLGVAASDLVAVWIDRSAADALHRRQRHLDMLDDHSRITGWMASGTPLEKDRG